MVNANQIAEVGAVVGEPARAAMLAALMDGRALTATELAGVAGITPQTASSHLTRLVAAHLVKVDRQGRHRYHRLASSEVARMLEGVMQLASGQNDSSRPRLRVGPRDQAMRTARTCYDHIAGRLGVAISDALVTQGIVEIDDEAGLITEKGLKFLSRIGIELPARVDGVPRLTRPICRPCLDWSERRPHLAGRLGAALCSHCLEHGWVRRIKGTRALEITRKGETELRQVLRIGPLD